LLQYPEDALQKAFQKVLKHPILSIFLKYQSFPKLHFLLLVVKKL